MGLFKRLSLAAKGGKPSAAPTQPSQPAPTSAPSSSRRPAAAAAALDKPTEDALRALARYDTVLLCDDSGSMEPMWETELAPALAAVVRTAVRYDEDGVDLAFFNSRVTHTSTSADDLLDVFRRVRPRSTTPTADAVKRVLEPYMRRLEEWQSTGKSAGAPRPKPLNLIVLTDGAPDKGQSPEDVLVDVARRLDKGRFPPFQVGCSFVQIGNYSDAAEHLRSLDDDLKQKHGIRDMVDTTLFEGACDADYLLKALLGGINRSIDKRN
ncbi:hypothetical protein JCM3775_000064 [Rhodotorula graminis]|uniref:VWFA domain-containing protein n=1 Tax=Rhodotorula graminis (strain WP1) TaxID=578459 RepID=A0A194S1Y0_RHOGW|nr:uncharacterized protein RHOBADRAFT_53686 [Rhodotorula graminis WP1]KPV74738.1 hypothetical protein RHOBADRAFT_53686 [Rhodotorula graminis WP1]